MRYNRDLMMAILWDRMPYLTPLLNAEIIPLEDAVAAYGTFPEGSPKKYVIDPHDTTGLTAAAWSLANGPSAPPPGLGGSRPLRPPTPGVPGRDLEQAHSI